MRLISCVKKITNLAISAVMMAALSLSIHASEEEILKIGEMVEYDLSDRFANSEHNTEVFDSDVDGSNFFYNQLSDVSKTVYNEILKLKDSQNLEPIIIPLPEPIVLKFSTKAGVVTDDEKLEYKKLIDSIAPPAYAAVMADHPDLFWFSKAYMTGFNYYNYDFPGIDGKYSYYFTDVTIQFSLDEAFDDFNAVNDYYGQIDTLLEDSNIVGENRYEKVKEIYNFVGERCYYKFKGKYMQNIIGALFDTEAVCEAYAEAFKLLCDYYDIPCLLVIGQALPSGENHMWNYVQMEDGKWYGLDLTWDDYGPQDTTGSNITYDYFLKCKSVFDEQHSPSGDLSNAGYALFTYPELSSENYEYISLVKGDVNGDSKVDLGDVLVLSKYLIGTQDLEDLSNADVYEDEKIDIIDLCTLKRMLVEAE